LLVGSRLTQKFEIYLMKVEVGATGSAYLGQTPPGLQPQVFAPGIVSIPSAVDFAGTFSPDGAEFYFTRRLDGKQNVIYETHLVNGDWTAPAPAAFAASYAAFEPHVTADSNILYFGWAHSRYLKKRARWRMAAFGRPIELPMAGRPPGMWGDMFVKSGSERAKSMSPI
jgi:hypothetical protein